jgi:hypothetical protein
MENEKKLWDIFSRTGDPRVYRLYKAVKDPEKRRAEDSNSHSAAFIPERGKTL